MNKLKRITYLIFLAIIMIVLSSCFSKFKKRKIYTDNNGSKIYNFGFFNNSEIILPKNQTNGQSLSVIVKASDGSLIVFDGGRKEDANYLCDIIKENGGIVKAWYLTHIHDDHIGALYQILEEKKFNIEIKNLYYKFADFDWYYSKIGNDAGILYVFEEALKKYNESLYNENKTPITVNDNISKGEIYNFGNVSIEVLNPMYKLDQDPINNTSIVYRVEIDDKSMIIYGDLGSAGGDKLIVDAEFNKLVSDIIVLSHHGQNGVGDTVYYIANPKIVIWPTSKDIYENVNNKYDTDATKHCIESMNVQYQILTYIETSIIK